METAILFFAFMMALFFGWGVFGSIFQLIVAILLWMMIGNVTGHIIRGEDYGVAGNIALGLIGGVVGTLLLGMVGLGGISTIPLLGSLITGVFGALIVVNFVHWLER